MAARHPLLEPFVPSASDPFDRVRAAHLLNRAGFGPTPAEIDRVLKLGPRAAADDLLDFPDAPAEEQSQEDVPTLSALEGLPPTFREFRKQLAQLPTEERQALQMAFQRGNSEAVREIGSWWVRRMAYGPFPLHQFMDAGDASRDELIGGLERGLLVTRFHYTNPVHPKLAMVTGMTRDGLFLVEGGEVRGPVRNLRFTQSYLAALAGVEAIGRERKLLRGFLGSVVVPAVRISAFTFTGATEH